MVIVSTVPVPCEVLLLKSCVVYVTLPVFNVIGFGDPVTLTMRRSIWSLTVTDPLALVLAGVGSGSAPDADDDSVSDPPAVCVPTIVTKELVEAGIVDQLQVSVPADSEQRP